MKITRKFRLDYKPLNQPFQFTAGEVATVKELAKPLIKIKVKEKEYTLPFRDFMVSTVAI